MGNRAAREKAAIEQSAVHSEEGKKRPMRHQARRFPGLYASWGGLDAVFYFRWCELEMGFRTHGIEPQAETIGQPLVALWDNFEALKDRAKRDPKLLKLVDYIMRTTGGAAARPGSSRQTKGCMQPDKTTDDQLRAVRRYRRVHAGMLRLKAEHPTHYAVLNVVCVPRRYAPEIETKWGYELADLCMRLDRTTGAHATAMAKEAEHKRVTLETWILRRIEKNDKFIELAREEAEKMASEAIQAFEAVTELPKAMREADETAEEADAAAQPKKRTRAPKVVSLGYDDEPGEEVA